MKYLIVGLGNIGAEYDMTRHNIGFRVADAIAARLGVRFETKRYGDVAMGRAKSAQIVLLKPSTYMNLSGEAVRYWMSTEKIPIERVLVIVDDLALPFGALRLKGKGSDAGHNGLKNIAQLLGSQAYPRLRFGIGNDYPQGKQIDYVLGSFHTEEEARLPQLIEYACEATAAFCLEGITSAMNKYTSAAPTDL